MNRTVIEHVLCRLKDIGIRDIFGIAGDYAFPVDDAICADKTLRWIGCCNELNASYAADGYARIHGMAALCTTFGVGELSAINGITGAYAEYVPIFHIVGMPSTKIQADQCIVHHTLGNGKFDIFHNIAENVVCAKAILTPENAVAETERLIAAMLEHRRPVYMGIATDVASSAIVVCQKPDVPKKFATNLDTLQSAVNAVVEKISESRTACIFPGIMVSRFGLTKEVTKLIDTSGLPFATMMMDKAILDESHPKYIGMYGGTDDDVSAFVDACDCVLLIGVIKLDFNVGYLSTRLKPERCVEITYNSVRVGQAVFENVLMKDMLELLIGKLGGQAATVVPKIVRTTCEPRGEPSDKISVEYLYPRWRQMLKPNDIVAVDTGTSCAGLAFDSVMPSGITFHNQTLWSSIGWATPAAFGMALASPNRRLILVTGEGSHQVSVQEICQFQRFKLKPLIFVLNNSGYLIERLLGEHPDYYYNDLAEWHYSKLPDALGCEGWFTARVTTCGELDQAITSAETSNLAAYIEVVTPKYAAPGSTSVRFKPMKHEA